MQGKILTYTVSLIVITAVCGGAAAQETQKQTMDLVQLQQQLIRLQQQLEQMKKEHQAEIQALKEQMQKAGRAEAVTQEQTQQQEIEALLAQMQEIAGEQEPEKTPEETVFRFKGLGLQALNPEISVSGDMLGSYTNQAHVRRRTDFSVRSFELNFQSYLDPFSRFKATVPIDDAGEIEVEEAYFTRFNVLGNFNLTFGKFRQQFGVINRWHGDALDQVDYPLPITMIFGDNGLYQPGIALDWTMPEWGKAAQELNLQLTRSENEQLYGGETQGNPSLLFHYKNFRDLSKDAYFEFGLSGLFGWNDQWQVNGAAEYNALGTQVLGADFTYVWEPIERAMYRNIEWRSEIFTYNRDILAPDGSGSDSLCGWGAFSYVHSKIDRNLYLGVRGDYFAPDTKDYAGLYTNAPITPLAYASSNPYRWQVAPYITWWQSEFVRFHLEYNYADGRGMGGPGHVFWLQVVFAAGPHKHERY